MAIRAIVGAFLAAVVMFIWGFIFWALQPLPVKFMQKLPNEDAVANNLKQYLSESGHYFYPFPESFDADPATLEAAKRKHEDGPIFMLVYRHKGIDAMSPLVMGIGFLHFFVCALFAAFLMLAALPNLTSYAERVGFVLLLGLFAVFFVHIGKLIWFHQPPVFPLADAFYGIVAWLLAGFVLGAFMRPKTV